MNKKLTGRSTLKKRSLVMGCILSVFGALFSSSGASAQTTGMHFDGVDDQVNIGTNVTPLAGADFTLEAWVKTTAINQGIITLDVFGTGWIIGEKCFYIDNLGKPAFVGHSNAFIFGSTVVNDGNWHHVAVTWNQGTFTGKMYVDGNDCSAGGGYTGNNGDVGTYWIGRPNFAESTNFFSGSMDEVRIWNVTRTQLQIQGAMNCDVPQNANLKGYYRFDEGTPAGNNTVQTKTLDYSGNALCGGLEGFALTGATSNFVTGAINSCNAISLTIPAAMGGSGAICLGNTSLLTNATPGGVWSSSNTSVATVSSSGLVTSLATGTTTIAYTLNCNAAGLVVTVSAVPTAISGNPNICLGATNALSSSPGGTWSSANTLVATVNASGSVTGLTIGTSRISYIMPSGCFRTQVVSVNPVPTAISGGDTVIFCVGRSTLLSSSPSGGLWTSGLPSVATVNSATGLVTAIGSGNATITYTNSFGCFVSKQVSVNPALAPITGTPIVCLGQPISVAVLNHIIPGGIWSSSNVAKAKISGSTGLIKGVALGTATITYTLTGGCFATTVLTVNGPVATITGGLSICPGATTDLNNVTPGGTWSSSDTNLAFVTPGPGLVTGVGSGIATISYIVNPGCYKTANVSILGSMLPIAGVDTLCQGAATALSSGPAGGTWSSSNTAAATIGLTSGVVSGLSTGTARITYRLSSGCFVTRVVTVNATVPTITGTTNVCPGASATLENATSGGTWSSSNLLKATIDASSGAVTGISSGTAVITYMLSSTCYKTTVQTVNPGPAVIGGSNTVCEGATATLSSSTGGVWSSTNAAAATVSTAGIVQGISAGVTTISYVVPGTGCGVAHTLSVNMTPATISGASNVCIGATTALTSATDGGLWSSSNTIKAAVDTGSGIVSGLQAGTANISYTLPNGCFRKWLITVSPVPGSINGKDTLCPGMSTPLSNTTSGGTWSSSNTGIATVGLTSGVVTGIESGVVSIAYNIGGGCAAVRSVTVNAQPAPITGGSFICLGSPLTLSSEGVGVWSSSNSAIASVNSASGVVSGLTTGTANISFTFTNGCYRKSLVSVGSGVAPIVGSPVMFPGGVQPFTSSTPGGTWSSSDSGILAVNPISGFGVCFVPGTVIVSYSLSGSCYDTMLVTCIPLGSRPTLSQSAENAITIAPNPTSGVFGINTTEAGTLEIITLDGRKVAEFKVTANNTSITLPENIGAGIYQCRFNAASGNTTVLRMVVVQ